MNIDDPAPENTIDAIIRAALMPPAEQTVDAELLESLKDAVRLWDEHKATHEYHITAWRQAIARAEQKGG